jgi:hypothetical protein
MTEINTKLAANELIKRIEHENKVIKIAAGGAIIIWIASSINLTIQALLLFGIVLIWIYKTNHNEIERLKGKYLNG